MRTSRKTCLATAAVAATGIAVGGAVVATIATGAVLYSLLRPRKFPENAVIVITGGSRGLGLAIASRFARKHKVRLVLAARNRQELEQAQATLLERHPNLAPADFYLVPVNLMERSECERLITETMAHFGRIDLLVNNAGIIEVGPLESQSLEAFERAIKLHYLAPLYTIWAAIPYLRKQEPLPGGGHRASIVNISSIGGKAPVPHLLPYVGSKFALTGLSEGLHVELRKRGIRVTTVCPGLMRTGGEEHAQFVGYPGKEAKWFKFSAKMPGLSASVDHAASRIYNAVLAGCAEITITPQAWVLARKHGMFPGAVQYAGSVVNEYFLPPPPKEDIGLAGESTED
jgi:NAD(P)-dependent dehydrogenase (short-subunit alcohol dehydrogenase family)